MTARRQEHAGAIVKRLGRKVESALEEPASFVMLLWLEPRDRTAEPEWRWRVKRVQTGEQAHFRRLADVLAYVARQAGAPAPR